MAHATKISFWTWATLGAFLLVMPAWGQTTTAPAASGTARKLPEPATRPSGQKTTGKGKAQRAASGMSKKEFKAQKRARKVEKGKRREERVEQHIRELQQQQKGVLPALIRPAVANPQQVAEDFDWSVNWEQKNNKGVHPNLDYGYCSTNHLAAAGCATGEIGGIVSGSGISWLADHVAVRSVLLDVQTPLRASGWCTFGATGGDASVGWFNSTYAAPDTVPHTFLGWRNDGGALRPALGTTGTSFADGAAIAISGGKPFQWTLSYDPIGGENGCGQITLSALGSFSTLSLSREQRNALSNTKFDRFGIVTSKTGAPAGMMWLDNLIYTRLSGFPAPNPQATAHTRTEFFDTNPTGSMWFGVNNLPTDQPPLVSQNYGYQPPSTGIGHTAGCIGGRFMRAIGASYYGYDYGEKKLHLTDKLRSEGYVQIPTTEGQGFRMGWTTTKALSWREPSTIALRFGFKHGGITVWVDFNTRTGEGKGGGAWQPVATLKPGPQWHHYVLEYDPAGTGKINVRFDDAAATYQLKYGIKELDADIDLFGVWNPKVPADGAATTAYVDDVINTVNGRPCPSSNNFDSAPAGWVGLNNSFSNKKDYICRNFHNFGWVKGLSHMDGSNPEDNPMYVIPSESQRYCAGGAIWLASWDVPKSRACYGADLGGTLNARDHHMLATGRIKLDWANVDAAELFGWYNSATATDAESAGRGHTMPSNFLGVKIDGGAMYFAMPGYRSPNLSEEHAASAAKFIPEPLRFEYPPQPPRLHHDGQWRQFYLEYDPDGAGGKGQIKVQIGSDGVPFTFDLQPGAKGENFKFDRFGLLTERKGGGKLHAIYFDKLTYTVAR
jgi:hypothetical protein